MRWDKIKLKRKGEKRKEKKRKEKNRREKKRQKKIDGRRPGR